MELIKIYITNCVTTLSHHRCMTLAQTMRLSTLAQQIPAYLVYMPPTVAKPTCHNGTVNTAVTLNSLRTAPNSRVSYNQMRRSSSLGRACAGPSIW